MGEDNLAKAIDFVTRRRPKLCLELHACAPDPLAGLESSLTPQWPHRLLEDGRACRRAESAHCE